MTRTERRALQRKRRIFAARAVICLVALLAVITLVLAVTTPTAAEGEADAGSTKPPCVSIIPEETEQASRDPAEYLAKTLYGEARGCSTVEQATVVWCVLNRVDDESGLWPDDIIGVVKQRLLAHILCVRHIVQQRVGQPQQLIGISVHQPPGQRLPVLSFHGPPSLPCGLERVHLEYTWAKPNVTKPPAEAGGFSSQLWFFSRHQAADSCQAAVFSVV